jgi:uncharacterized MAPEG superfamily protein
VSPTLTSLLVFAAWTVLLVAVSLLHRTVVVFLRRHPANAWPRGKPPPDDEPAFMIRLRDAHLNCAENLPVFGAIVVVAAVADRLGSLDPVAPYLVAARLAQSITHLIGTGHWHVFVRASFFGVQLGLYAYMLVALL